MSLRSIEITVHTQRSARCVYQCLIPPSDENNFILGMHVESSLDAMWRNTDDRHICKGTSQYIFELIKFSFLENSWGEKC